MFWQAICRNAIVKVFSMTLNNMKMWMYVATETGTALQLPSSPENNCSFKRPFTRFHRTSRMTVSGAAPRITSCYSGDSSLMII